MKKHYLLNIQKANRKLKNTSTSEIQNLENNHKTKTEAKLKHGQNRQNKPTNLCYNS